MSVSDAISKGVTPPCGLTWSNFDSDLEITYYENEDDCSNLIIYECYDLLDDLETNKKYIYMVSCACDNRRASQLLDYILSIDLLSVLELHSIWAGDHAKYQLVKTDTKSLSVEMIFNILDNFNLGLAIKKSLY